MRSWTTPTSGSSPPASSYRLRHVELERENRSPVEELGASWESVEAVYEISSDMRLFRDPTDVLDRITARAVSSQDGLQAIVWREDAGLLVPVPTKNTAAIDPRPSGDGLLGRVLEQHEAVILNGQARIATAANLEPELRQAIGVVITPVATRQAVLGALEVWRERGDSEFDSRMLRLLETLALQAAMVIENDRLRRESIESERLRQEIQTGSEIQQMLLLGRLTDFATSASKPSGSPPNASTETFTNSSNATTAASTSSSAM
jgi:GAF domain-containing protein